MRILALILIVVLVGSLLLHFAGSGPDRLEGLSGTEPVVEHAASERDVAAAQVAPTQRREEDADHSASVERALSLPDGEPATVSARLRPASSITGEVVLIDSDGAEWFGLSGEGVAELLRAGRSTYERFPIDGGRFLLERPKATHFELWSVTLDGKPAFPEFLGQRIELDGQPLALRVVRPPQIELHVLDAITEQHLDQVELRSSSSSQGMYLSYPNEFWNHREVEGDRSPLTIVVQRNEVAARSRPFLVHSPGYAWKPMTLDMRTSGKREVRLERACELKVTLVGELPFGTNHLAIYEKENEGRIPIADVDAFMQREHEFEGLPPGAYRVRLELGTNYGNRVPVAETVVELMSGSSRQVVLEIGAPRVVERALLSGMVEVAPGWSTDSLGVYAHLKGDLLDVGERSNFLSRSRLLQVEGVEGAYMFDFGELQLGDYTVGVRNGLDDGSFDITRKVQLGEGGATGVLLHVPAPCQIQVEVFGAISGEPVDCRVFCAREVDGNLDGFSFPKNTSKGDPVEFTVPVGQVRLITNNETHVPRIETHIVGPGLNRFSLQLERACLVRLRLGDAGDAVPWPEEMWAKVRSVSGERDFHSFSGDSAFKLFSLPEPGRYRLQTLEIHGFEPVQGFEFEARAGETLEYTIPLRPE